MFLPSPQTILTIRELGPRSFGRNQDSPCWMISSSLGLCLAWRPVRGSVFMIRAGLGWPTRSRALALTALAAENFPGLRFVMARLVWNK